MKTKIEKQNELIDAIIDWNNKGKTLGYSKAQELINEYERQVKLFSTLDVNNQREMLLSFVEFIRGREIKFDTDSWLVDVFLSQQ